MALSTRALSLFLSVIIGLTALTARADEALTDSTATRRTAFAITSGNGAHLSGILLSRRSDDLIAGTMVNEFGLTALSFIYRVDKGKMELRDVTQFLDKWYIKRVLRSDLSFCIHRIYDLPYPRKHRYLVTTDADTVTITNPRHHLTYSFSPLAAPQSSDEATR